MATHLKIVFLTCLLLLVVLMEDVKPALAKKKPSVKKRVTTLEKIIGGLKDEMEALEEKVDSMAKPEPTALPPTTPSDHFMCQVCTPSTSQEKCDSQLHNKDCKSDQRICIAVHVVHQGNEAFARDCFKEDHYQQLKDACQKHANCKVGRCSTSGCLAKLGHDE